MQTTRVVGRHASAQKYDILTALGAFALSRPPSDQRRVLRLMTLITARYNWTRDELGVGQREIAKLWFCTERTVKRDFAVFRQWSWLVLKRQGARGHVSVYGLNLEQILADTTEVWPAIGPDFQERAQRPAAEAPSNVLALPHRGDSPRPEVGAEEEWDLARIALHGADPGLYGAWIHALVRERRSGDHLVLRAPSRFHATYVATHLSSRLLLACQAIDASITGLEIVN